MDGTVLVADDDRTIRTVLTQALTRAGCKVHATSSLTTLMRWVGEGKGDVVISDVMMPDGNGLEMLPKIAQDRPGLPVIVISAQNTVMTAIKAAEAEAYDYLPKPFDLPDLMKRTARALELRGKSRSTQMPATQDSPEDLPLIGRSDGMQALYRFLAGIMNTDLPVLIWGESGVGKSLIARAIHDFSARKALPFVTVSPEDLPDSQSCARVLERARGGTVLFDGITDFPEETQARIVHMMDEAGETTPRFLTSSQKDLALQMPETVIRADLYYRLSGAALYVPALRERVDDIELLALHFLNRNLSPQRAAPVLSKEAVEVLRKYSWPGNVRQLENLMRRLELTTRNTEISALEVQEVLGSQPEAARLSVRGNTTEKLSESVARHLQRYFDLHGDMLPPAGLYGRILREIEVPLIEIALDATGGNQAKCADLLGINRNTLRKKITELEIEVTRRRKMM